MDLMPLSRPSYLLLGPPSSLSLAVTEFCFVARGICGGFSAKYLAATFPRDCIFKIIEIVCQIFCHVFRRCRQRIT